MNDKRPRNLDFTTFRLPLPAITSILHRISGAFIFAGMAVLLWLLSESLASQEGFSRVGQWLELLPVKLLVWAVLSGLFYHFVAGIKHLLMDLGVGETIAGGLLGARLVIAISALAIIITGVWIW